MTSGVGVWQRRSLLFKLSGQTQLLEELAEISVDRLGAIATAADGTRVFFFFLIFLFFSF